MSRIFRAVCCTLLIFLGSEVWAGGVLRLGNNAEPETLDPHKAQSVPAANILRDLYEGLTIEDPHGNVIPGAADRWEISNDERVYTFHLRENARWSNGDPVTADDFVAGLRRSADPRTGSGYAQILAPIENAEAVTAGRLPPEALHVSALDAHDLQIRLRAPTPYFLGLLNHQATYPIHRPSLQKYGEQFARADRLVGNGAYRLVEWVVQARVTVERNPYYWDNMHTSIDRVEYFPTEDAGSEFKRYRAGELDVTSTIQATQLPWIRTHLSGELHLEPYLGVSYYGFNLTRPPFRDNLKLREALVLAIDPAIIVDKVMQGAGVPASGWILPGMPGYEAQRTAWADWPWPRRIGEARRLYAEAGYSPQHPLNVEIRYNTQNDNRRIATVMAAMWKQTLGANVSLVNEEWKVFLQNRRQRAVTQVFRGSWIGDYNDPLTFLEILGSHHGMNASGYASATFDALLARAAAEPDPQRRMRTLEAAEREVLTDLPVLPISFYVSKHLVKPRVLGWENNIADIHYSKDLRIAPESAPH